MSCHFAKFTFSTHWDKWRSEHFHIIKAHYFFHKNIQYWIHNIEYSIISLDDKTSKSKCHKMFFVLCWENWKMSSVQCDSEHWSGETAISYFSSPSPRMWISTQVGIIKIKRLSPTSVFSKCLEFANILYFKNTWMSTKYHFLFVFRSEKPWNSTGDIKPWKYLPCQH